MILEHQATIGTAYSQTRCRVEQTNANETVEKREEETEGIEKIGQAKKNGRGQGKQQQIVAVFLIVFPMHLPGVEANYMLLSCTILRKLIFVNFLLF